MHNRAKNMQDGTYPDKKRNPAIMRRMLTSQRKQLILSLLKRDGQIIAKELSREWNVSEDTIRRDLRELADEGRLVRVHGGAMPTVPAEQNFAARQNLAQGAKDLLGKKGASLVKPGSIVFVDGGTTNAQLVRHLPLDLQATVITHSPSVAVELVEHGNIEVILIGGRLFKHSLVSVGTMTVEAIEGIRADLFFLGATGIHPDHGVTTGDLEESYVKRAFAQQAAETVLLASADKIGAVSPYKILAAAEIGTLVVEPGLDPLRLKPFAALGLGIVEAFA